MTDKLTQTGSQASQELSRSLCQDQIICHGVDVSECDHFREGYCHPGTGVCYKCDTNCQYAAFYLKEQLARKTQECEKIKEKYEALKLENQEGYEIVAELKQECEELKKQLMQKDEVNTFLNTPIEGWSNNPCDICESKNNYERLNQECEELKELLKLRTNDRVNKLERAIIRRNIKIDRYRKALDEIEKELKEDVYCESQECGCDDFEECLNCVKTQILNIINKAKGEE